MKRLKKLWKKTVKWLSTHVRAVILGIVGAGALAVAVLHVHGLYETRQANFWLIVGVLAVVVIALARTSVYLVGPDDMIASYFLGTYRGTYVNRTSAKKPEVTAKGGKSGHVWDFVFLLYPLWRGIRFPRTTIKLPIRVGRVYTKNTPTLARVRLVADTTITLQLAPNVADLVETVNIWGHGDDLTEEGEFALNDRRGDVYRFHGPRIAYALLSAGGLEKLLEAVRAGGVSRTWTGPGDIVADKQGVEADAEAVLTEADSVYRRCGLIVPTSATDPTPIEGPAALAFDLIVEDVYAEGEAMTEAIDAPLIAHLQGQAEALREQRRREGQAAGLKKIADSLDLKGKDRALPLIVEGFRDTQSKPVIITGGEGLMGTLKTLLGVGKKKKGP